MPVGRASLIALILLGGGAVLYAAARPAPEADYRFDMTKRGSVESVVMGTGTLTPVNLVTVGSEVSGRISELHADFNDRVERGEVIARLDPDMFMSRLEQARADLRVAQAGIAQRRAELERAMAERSHAERTLERRRRLVAQGHGSTSELDEEETRLAMANAQVSVAEALLLTAEAFHEHRLAAFTLAELDAARTLIRSPATGTVIKRSVEVGQTVAASLAAPELFEIADDLTRMNVEADIDEADIGQLAEGMPCRFMVDAFPGRTFHGRVDQIRKAPRVVQTVVTYKVLILVENEDLVLLPGMTANVVIVTGRREDIVLVPNAALRYVPQLPGLPDVTSDRTAHVWQLVDSALKRVPVVTGLTDDRFTEVVAGLGEAEHVVVGSASPKR